jgi:cytochrome c oxidase accessory protein FixG
VFYFADAPTLAADLLAFQAPAVSYLFIAILTFATYLLGGIAREQVCIYMCPWPRIQAAMLDEETLTVTYRRDRGEPRGAYRKGAPWDGRGHCIDCRQCVVVCPTGIDIRDGLQLECISCALCADACNEVMGKVGLPPGLIAYDTDANIARRERGEAPRVRLLRPRTLAYAGIIAVVGLVMLAGLATRDNLDLNVLRDRNPLFTRLADGGVRNGYTVKILNKLHREAVFDLGIEGLPTPEVKLVGVEPDGIRVGADTLRSFRVFLSLPAARLAGENTPVRFAVTERASGEAAGSDSQFLGPKP